MTKARMRLAQLKPLRCPKCKSTAILVEASQTNTCTYVQNSDGLLFPAQEGEPSLTGKNNGRCTACDYSWVFRKDPFMDREIR